MPERTRDLRMVVVQPAPALADMFRANTLQAFVGRTELLADTARQRIVNAETVPNCDKLFSNFEPHAQLYKLGKVGEAIQFGRQVLVFEDPTRL